MRIIIPERLPSLNEVINANRGNKYAGANMKKQIDQTLSLYIKNQCKEKYERIHIHIDWYEPNMRRDYDNIVSSKKFILDALVKCKVIPNDGWKNIEPTLIDNIYLDKKKPRIEINIVDSTDYGAMIRLNAVMINNIQREQDRLQRLREIDRNKDQIHIEEII